MFLFACHEFWIPYVILSVLEMSWHRLLLLLSGVFVLWGSQNDGWWGIKTQLWEQQQTQHCWYQDFPFYTWTFHMVERIHSEEMQRQADFRLHWCLMLSPLGIRRPGPAQTPSARTQRTQVAHWQSRATDVHVGGRGGDTESDWLWCNLLGGTKMNWYGMCQLKIGENNRTNLFQW